MAEFRNWIAALIRVQSPASPRNWWSSAHRLSKALGWIPAMMLGTICCAALSVRFAIGRPPNDVWVEAFNWLALAAWAIVATLVMLQTVVQTAETIGRLGAQGFCRSRWWFGMARTTWNIAVIALVGLLMAFVMSDQQRQFLDPLLSGLYTTHRIAALAFFLLATMGYLLSFSLRQSRRGRAYECVHYFYSICGSIGVVTYAAILCPPNPGVHVVIGCGILGTIGMLWFVLGIFSMIRRLQTWERLKTHA